jgi:hypothetical protein
VNNVKTDKELQQAGYTASGAKRYQETVAAYSATLYNKAVVYGHADKATDTNLEVTHDHVRAAAHNITTSFGREQPSKMGVPIQIAEYLLTALAGVASGNLKEQWGIIMFVVCVALAVILFVVRNNGVKR